jgi:hypothetical protein
MVITKTLFTRTHICVIQHYIPVYVRMYVYAPTLKAGASTFFMVLVRACFWGYSYKETSLCWTCKWRLLNNQYYWGFLFSISHFLGRAMAQAVSRRPPTAEARVRSRVSLCGICGGQSGTGTSFSPSSSVFPCQFHSTGAPLLGKWQKNNLSFSAYLLTLR